MHSKIDKLSENKSRVVEHSISNSHESHKSNLEFIDNRPEAIAHKTLPAIADNSPRAMQLKAAQTVMNKNSAQQRQLVQKKENNTGLPDNLKSGVESLSGYFMDDVKVHYNSDKPAQLNAHAYAQGTDIHLASGQEKHLPHEAWHVVQQKQGRVTPTLKMEGGVNVNDDASLEKEADVMGEKALQSGGVEAAGLQLKRISYSSPSIPEVQCSTVQKKRKREEEDESSELSQLTQFKEHPLQLYAETAQLAITDPKEAPPGTRIMVVNHEASDTGDIGTVARLSRNRDKCMVVEFDNEPHVMYRVYFREIDVISTSDQAPSSGAKKSEEKLLHEMIMNVISIVASMPDELNKVMEPDETDEFVKVSPQQQLQKCIQDCKNKSAEEVAIYLYTTYFYSPLNKYLRDSKNANMGESVEKLISITHAFLMRAFRGTPGEKLTPKFRMELKPGWIGDKGVGEELSFQGFTSTHPELEGVNHMWGDIESGAFGDYDKEKLALLIFEGDSKLLRPDVKYFPNENEMILPAGIKAKITKKYDIAWYGWKVAVYHLIILPETQNPSDFNVTFEESGNVVVDKK